MKLRDVAKGTWAIKAVMFRLANAVEAPQPGAAPSDAPVDVTIGVRVLTGAETSTVYEKAQAYAKERGVPEWKDEHPLCRLAQMVFTLAVACVDIESDSKSPEPFFDNAEQIFESKNVGTDNIAYLFERWTDWQDECSIEKKNLSLEESIGIMFQMAEKDVKETGDFLARMRPGLRASFMHFMAARLSSLLKASSLSTSLDASNTDSSKSNPTGSDAGLPTSN